MLQQEAAEAKGSVAVYPTMRNEVDDASLLSVNTVNPLEGKNGDAGTELLEDGTEKRVEEEEAGEEEKAEKTATPEKKADGEKSKVDVSSRKKIPDAVQKRFDELTRKRYDAERRAESERTRRVEVEKELQELRKSASSGSKPKAEDFETEAAYTEALVDWSTETKVRAAREKDLTNSKAASLGAEAVAEKEVIVAIIDKGREKYEDFNEKAFAQDLVLDNRVLQAVLAVDNAEDVLYFLASNPEESKRVSALSGTKLAVELGRIEERLLMPKPQIFKKTTKTPAPIKPVQTTGAVERDPLQMSMKEYRAWRERNKE